MSYKCYAKAIHSKAMLSVKLILSYLIATPLYASLHGVTSLIAYPFTSPDSTPLYLPPSQHIISRATFSILIHSSFTNP